MADSAGVSNIEKEDDGSTPLTVEEEFTASIPGLSSIANTVNTLVTDGLSIDEAAQKVAQWVDPSILPALVTLASVLTAVEKYV